MIKNIFKKIFGLIKRHIILFILCVFAIIAMAIMIVAFLKMTINTSGKYGNRLEGIEEVEISKKELKEKSSELENLEEVSKAKIRIHGKIVYVDITYNANVELNRGKEIASTVFEKFSEEELTYYDFSFIISRIANEEGKDWNSAGSKNTEAKEISWTLDKVVQE